MTMSHCKDCEQTLTNEQKIALHEKELIELAKQRGRTWAKHNTYIGNLYIHRTKNGFGFKRLEELDGREVIDTYYVSF